MISATNTLVDNYVWFFPLDPAFHQLAPNATEEEAKAHVEAWNRAVETGIYEEVCILGRKPTSFTVKHLTGMRKRRVIAAIEDQPVALQQGNLVRACLVSASGPDHKPVMTTEYDITLATDATIDWLDALDPAIVPMLAATIVARMRLSGKS
jgi:hypothetical protein